MATFLYEGDRLSMTVYIPEMDIHLPNSKRLWVQRKSLSLRSRQTAGEKKVYFPKFELKSELILNEPLVKLG